MKELRNKIGKIKASLATKEMTGKPPLMVTCPECGMTFDYNCCSENSIEKYIIRELRWMLRYAADDVVREFVMGLKPEIKIIVEGLLNDATLPEMLNDSMIDDNPDAKEAEGIEDSAMKNLKFKELTIKAQNTLTSNLMKYVNCVKCGSPVMESHKSSLITVEPATVTRKEMKPIQLVKELNFEIK